MATENTNCTWIPFYEEMADKLLTFKNKRKELLDIVYALDEKHVGYIRKNDGSHESDIDPFTFFGIFNRGISNANRIMLCQYFKKKMGIAADVPSDFDGVPVLMNMKATFYWRRNVDTDVQPLWDFFEAALSEDEERIKKQFDVVRIQRGVKWNLTMGLYWIRPYSYISLDSRNRSYLPSLSVPVFSENELDANHYFTLLRKVKELIDNRNIKENNIPDISYNAWILDENQKPKRNYWLVGYSFGSTKSQFDRFIKDSIWEGRFNDDSKSDLKLLPLAQSIKAGDVLILKSSSTKGPNHDIPFLRVKAVAVVTEDIKSDKLPGTTSCICNVEYYGVKDVDFENPSLASYRKTIHSADEKANELIEYANSLIENKNMPKQQYKEYIDLLLDNHNLILTGAPGTGKTYMAKKIAEEMEAEWEFVQFHPSYDYTDFVEGLRPVGDNGNFGFELRSGVFKDFCARALKNQIDSKKSIQALQQESSARDKIDGYLDEVIESGKSFNTFGTKNVFHVIENNEKTVIVEVPANEKTSTVKLPKSDLIALVENDVPVKKGKDMQVYFGRKHGTQQDAYVRVLYNYIKGYQPTIKSADVSLVELKKFVFIIDEINRGDISKIFGELFFSIDPGYRGEQGKVYTQYQNMIPDDDVFKKGFFVPENVYILATMNDIDRSVESMDFAMRRRFNWKEVTPAETQGMLDILPCAADAIATMQRLNLAIADTDGLGAAYMIGPSYFLKLNDNGSDFNKLWKMNIEPLLKEYLRGFRKSAEILDKFSKAFFNTSDSQKNDNPELVDED